MTEQTQAPEPQMDRPGLRDRTVKPEGTIPKQAQTYVVVGVSIVIVLAVLFSNKHAQPAAKNQGKEPTVVITEGNDKKITDFGQEITDEQRAAQKAQLEKQMQAQVRSLDSASVMQAGDTRQPVGSQYAGTAPSAPAPPPDPIVQPSPIHCGAALLSLISFVFRRPWAAANGGNEDGYPISTSDRSSC